jgi:hypothetical protein
MEPFNGKNAWAEVIGIMHPQLTKRQTEDVL